MRVIFKDMNQLPQDKNTNMPNIGGINVTITDYCGFEFPAHAHDFDELVIVLGGTGRHMVNDEWYNLIAGDVFVLKSGDTHALSDTRNLRFCNIAYTPHKLQSFTMDLAKLPGYHALFLLEPVYRRNRFFCSKFRLSAKDLFHVSELVNSMSKEYNSQAPASESMLYAYFIQLIIFLCRQYSGTENNHHRPIIALANAVSYMEIHYAEKITLERLAEIAGFSVNHFLRLFKEAYKLSPMNYLKVLRIRKAGELLKNPLLRITDIAYQVGIEDSNYFSRLFKEVTGMSAGRYRRSFQ